VTKDTPNDLPLPFPEEVWFDPLEEALRRAIRDFIEELLEGELEQALGRGRYQRTGQASGYRNGRRERQLLGPFGPLTVSLPRARRFDADGAEPEWRNGALPAFKRLTKRAEAVIAGSYLAGVNTRRLRRALQGRFGGAAGQGHGSAGPGASCGRPGRPGSTATWPARTSSG
jgi:transposase-like protein